MIATDQAGNTAMESMDTFLPRSHIAERFSMGYSHERAGFERARRSTSVRSPTNLLKKIGLPTDPD